MSMRDQILELEKLARTLEPDSEARAALTRQAQHYAFEFLDRLPETAVYRPAQHTPDIDLALQEQPSDFATLLHTVEEQIDTYGINPASGGHLGYIPGGGIYHAALGDYLADVSNRYSGIRFASPGAAELERQLVLWMCGLVGFGPGASGDLTSGGSIANLSAIVAAREARGINSAAIPASPIYCTAQVHHCVTKAVGIAGLRECPLRLVPMDPDYRMDTAALAQMLAADRHDGLNPWLVVASAGTTDTGAIDPLEELSELATEHQLWLHVDAAYGGAFLLCDYGQQCMRGISRADSVVLDPHKGFFLPYGSGAVLVRDGATLANAYAYQANYMQDAAGAESVPSPASLSPELTRPFRGLRLWFPLRLAGLAAFRACLDEKLLLARYFHQRLSALGGFEVGPSPDLSVVTYRYVPARGDADAFNRRLIREIQDHGEVFISSTLIDGTFMLRLAVLNFRTHLGHIDRLLELLESRARRLETQS